MRIGIYDRWLSTLGGGERYVCAMADCLSKEHDVELLAESPVSAQRIREYLGIDLGEVRIVRVSSAGAYQNVVARTRAYDLFINCSHLDYFQSFARCSVLLVFFPQTPSWAPNAIPLPLAIAKRAKEAIARLVLAESARIRLVRGFSKPERAGSSVVRRIGDRSAFAVPREGSAARSVCLRVFTLADHADCPPPSLAIFVDGQETPSSPYTLADEVSLITVPLPERARSAESGEALIELQNKALADLQPGVDPLTGVVTDVGIAWAKLDQPAWSDALAELALGGEYWYLQNWSDASSSDDLLSLKSYQQIWAISGYTQRWIGRYWGRSSEILFPPCDPVPVGESVSKRNQIISVGRFFPGSHNKKHIPMIRAFKALCDRGLTGWEYHIAGGLSQLQDHTGYMRAVEKEAEGYPICIHKNAALGELNQLYAQSKLFWHATGLGEREDRAPERFEHFGITTVEAMSAGCVPIVIGKAGQIEIVRHGIDGYLWNTTEELRDQTLRLISDESLRESMSDRARERSADFDRNAFNRQLLALIEALPCGLAATT